jgi:serine/threonine-protein kinase
MLETGTAVGRYLIQRKLAEGGMAEIYLATATGAEGFAKEVVIKVVRPFLATDSQFVQMFIAEARLASRLDHANIVQIFDFGKHEHTYYLAMEYVRGASLWELRKRCRELGLPFPPTLAAEIGAQVARGLHFAHSLAEGGVKVGVVHRDVTPHNVLLSFDGAVKLTDFGIAKATTTHTAPGMLKGKFAYMSPEQARGDRVDGRTDVFALGILTWELLTGGRLFDGDSDVAVLRAVQESLIAPPTRLNPDVPRELSDVVMKALSRRPEERFQTAADLERALATFALRSAQSVEDTSVGLFLQQLFREEYAPELGLAAGRDAPTVDPADTLGSADTLHLVRSRPRAPGTTTHTPVGEASRSATPGPQARPEEVPGVETARPPAPPRADRPVSTEQLPTHKPGKAPRRVEFLPAPVPVAVAHDSPRAVPAPAQTLVEPDAPAPGSPRGRTVLLAAVAVLAGLGALGGGVAMTLLGQSPEPTAPANAAPPPVVQAAPDPAPAVVLPPPTPAEPPPPVPESPPSKVPAVEAIAPAPSRAEPDPAAARPAPRPVRAGLVKVFIRPFGFVSVNGARHVEVPGSKQLSLRPGRYELELFDNHQASVKRVTVTVEAGEALLVESD